MSPPLPDAREFVRAGKIISDKVFKRVKEFFEHNRTPKEVESANHKDRNNFTRDIDQLAQNEAENEIKGLEILRGHEILILEEETKRKYPKSLKYCKTLVAFVDPIDGTDLVVRGFGNWCLAVLFFYSPQRRIIASVIGHSSGEVYYATENEVCKSRPNRSRAEPLERDASQSIRLEDASLCFYGQKPKNFLALVTCEKMMSVLKQFRKRMQSRKGRDGERIDMRLYNFGGNPMMAKLADGYVDAVLGPSPQSVHDVVPGAFIARQAGAIFTTLSNKEISLEQSLLFPRKKLRYILSASRDLHTELLPLAKNT